jgi:hypothetical protein
MERSSAATVDAAGDRLEGSLELVYHFFNYTNVTWLGSQLCQQILQREGGRLALKAPYLLHAIIAVSAHHLSYLHPTERQYSIAAQAQYSLLLSSYISALEDIETANANALFASCMILNFIAFNNIAADQTPTKNGDKLLVLDIASLRSIRGFQILQESPGIEAKLDQSIWKPLMAECVNHPLANPLDAIPSKNSPIFHKLVQLCSDENGVMDAYEPSLQKIRLLMAQEKIGPDAIGAMFCFTRTLIGPFVQLLETQDEKALLLLCFWYSLISQLDQWWAIRSSRTGASNLVVHLRNSRDPRILELLRYPEEVLGGNH